MSKGLSISQVKGVNKDLSSENKLPYTCKDHSEVTTETVQNSQMKQLCSVLGQIEQSYPVFGSKSTSLD